MEQFVEDSDTLPESFVGDEVWPHLRRNAEQIDGMVTPFLYLWYEEPCPSGVGRKMPHRLRQMFLAIKLKYLRAVMHRILHSLGR